VYLQITARHQGQSRCSLAEQLSEECVEFPLCKILVCMHLQGLSRRMNCLAVHPSRPHLCVTGASSGMLAVWDLRMTSAPAVQSTSKPGSGDVLEVGDCTLNRAKTPKGRSVLKPAGFCHTSQSCYRIRIAVSTLELANILLSPQCFTSAPCHDTTSR